MQGLTVENFVIIAQAVWKMAPLLSLMALPILGGFVWEKTTFTRSK